MNWLSLRAGCARERPTRLAPPEQTITPAALNFTARGHRCDALRRDCQTGTLLSESIRPRRRQTRTTTRRRARPAFRRRTHRPGRRARASTTEPVFCASSSRGLSSLRQSRHFARYFARHLPRAFCATDPIRRRRLIHQRTGIAAHGSGLAAERRGGMTAHEFAPSGTAPPVPPG